MSLTEALKSPRTPMRSFLDRELSAGAHRVRLAYRARLPAMPVLWPPEEVGFEAGTVGTAIDQRLRLAFTCRDPVDRPARDGIDGCKAAAKVSRLRRNSVWAALADVGGELVKQLGTFTADLELESRGAGMLRCDDDEERLARMLLVAAWYAVNYRNPSAFPDTPLFQAAQEAPKARLTLRQALNIPRPALVNDMLTQLHAAEEPLRELRQKTPPSRCLTGPIFDGSRYVSADADLIADGTLIDFKSTRRVFILTKVVVQQLLGYTLMDITDTCKIDTVGLYLTRAPALITWPVEDYLALLGARRRDLAELRAAFAKVLTYSGCRADDDPLPEQLPAVQRLLAEVAAAIPPGCCRTCAQPLPEPSTGRRQTRLYCSAFCSKRSNTLRRHGWLA